MRQFDSYSKMEKTKNNPEEKILNLAIKLEKKGLLQQGTFEKIQKIKND